MPKLPLPHSLGFGNLLLHVPTLPLFSGLGAYNDPSFFALEQIHDADAIVP
jgi:hypothetical protein